MSSNKHNLAYGRTKKGLVTHIYRGQKSSSKNRGHVAPTYNLQELREWAFNSSKFHNLYDAWVDSGYKTELKPSFDRTDDYQGYCLSRLTIMTWGENKLKYDKDRINGVNNKQSKAVIQMDLSGISIKRFCSTMSAHRETGANQSHICGCCMSINKTAGGYKWKYANDAEGL